MRNATRAVARREGAHQLPRHGHLNSNCSHTFAFRRDQQCPAFEVAEGEDAVADQLDFTQEANGCFRLAESETQAEVKTILMGMGYGWLTLANRRRRLSEGHPEPIDEPTEEPIDDLV